MAIRLIHVGLGNWGQNWESAVLSTVTDIIDVVAFVDAHDATLETAQKALGLPSKLCYSDLDKAIAATDSDAVLATVPVTAHVPVAETALAAGKHVLIEKPFAPAIAEAKRVVDAAAESGCIAMVSQNYRFYPAVRTAMQLVAEEALGKVGNVNLDFRRFAQPRANSPYTKIEHPLLEDMAIHHFDLMRALLRQEPRTIVCDAWNPPWSPFAGPAAGAASITFDGGAHVSYRGNWVSPGPTTAWAGEWRVECERGEIVWTSRADNRSLEAERVAIRPIGGAEQEVELTKPRHWGRAGVLESFAEAITSGTLPETSVADNIHSLALTLAAVESAAQKNAVQL